MMKRSEKISDEDQNRKAGEKKLKQILQQLLLSLEAFWLHTWWPQASSALHLLSGFIWFLHSAVISLPQSISANQTPNHFCFFHCSNKIAQFSPLTLS